jgi:hypothetical protein
MKISITTFRGEAPRLTSRELPPNAAQVAINCRLQSGDLESWRQLWLTKTLTRTGAVQTIYKLNDQWISWNEQVDVARGVIAGDNTYRVFLTCPSLFATPRWTNYALATTGAEPYPVTTRPLGVPEPAAALTYVVGIDASPTGPSIDFTDSGGTIELWTISPAVLIPSVVRSSVVQTALQGNPQPSYQLEWHLTSNTDTPTFIARNFGIGGSAVVKFTSDWMVNEVSSASGNRSRLYWGVFRGESGSGFGVSIDQYSALGGWVLGIGKADSWSGGVSMLANTVGIAVTANTWWRMVIDAKANADGSTTITATVKTTADVLVATCTATLTGARGDFCGFHSTFLELPLPSYAWVDNIRVQASGATEYTAAPTATSYVFTYVNDLGEESAPSPPTITFLRPDGVTVTVTTPTVSPVDSSYGITNKRIYRAVSGATGTLFLFVAQIALATANFIDDLDDSTISNPGVPLESEDWDVPPPTLEGILSLPNGVMAGFFRNQLCLSAKGHPHAWPVKYRLTTDTDIVAIANIDNTIVVGTKSYVYTATGNDPENYSMSRPGAAQSCTSKRGMLYLDQIGVIFPSPDGYMVCSGSAGAVRNATETIFTKRQWQALDPTSVIAAVHDGVVHFFVTGTTPDAGYALDAKINGFGLIRLAYHATAVHADPIKDALYLVLDRDDEPTAGLLPLSSTKPTPTGQQIYQFDYEGEGGSDMVFRFLGKLNLLPYPAAMQRARVTAGNYTNLVVTFYGDGNQIYTKVVTSELEFTLPSADTYTEFQIELIGTSPARIASAAEDVKELD